MTEQATQPTAGLTMNDLAAVVRIIDVVTERGAIRGDELSQVGALRDKFVTFLKAAQPAEDQEPQAEVETKEEE